jgi:DNA-binding NarL/FixJ family response regulator
MGEVMTQALSPMTEKEREVLVYLSKGFSNPEIGKLIGKSQHTVADHVSAILTRLDVSTRVEAAVWAAKQGIV